MCSDYTSLYSKDDMFERSSMADCNVGISHSMGSTTSTPYANWKGANLVDTLTVVQYSHKDDKTM